MAAMLEAKNLMVFFENALALNDLSLEVREGEIVAVLGIQQRGQDDPDEHRCPASSWTWRKRKDEEAA